MYSRSVAGAQPMCPHANCNVRIDIGVQLAVFNGAVLHVVVKPPTIFMLVVG